MGRFREFADSACLVTGASSGIGRETSRQLAGRGARLAITARRQTQLEAVADGLGGDTHDPAATAAVAEERLDRRPQVRVSGAPGIAVPGERHVRAEDLAKAIQVLHRHRNIDRRHRRRARLGSGTAKRDVPGRIDRYQVETYDDFTLRGVGVVSIQGSRFHIGPGLRMTWKTTASEPEALQP